MSNRYGVHSGEVLAKRYKNTGAVAVTAGATPAIDASKSELFTLTPEENETISVSGGKNGQDLYLLVTTSGTSTYTLTFDSGFNTTGTLATGGTDDKDFLLHFKHIGGEFYEVSRTTAM